MCAGWAGDREPSEGQAQVGQREVFLGSVGQILETFAWRVVTPRRTTSVLICLLLSLGPGHASSGA